MKYLVQLLLFFIFISWLPSTYGQVKPGNSFLETLNKAQVAFAEPVENLYRNVKNSRNPLLKCDLAIKKRKGDMEIRYLIQPDDEQTKNWLVPHAAGMNTASHLASNQEESSQIVVHKLLKENLMSDFNADWGATFFFTPKAKFSRKKHCKMLVLYKEGKGLIYVFYLFDKISEELDNRAFPLRFLE